MTSFSSSIHQSITSIISIVDSTQSTTSNRLLVLLEQLPVETIRIDSQELSSIQTP